MGEHNQSVMVKMNRFDGMRLPGKEGQATDGLTFAQALYGYKRISDDNVAALKKFLSIPDTCRMGIDLFPRMDTRCKKLFQEMRDINLLAPPDPDGTRSSPSSKMNIFAANGHDVVGFCVWTAGNSVWVIFY